MTHPFLYSKILVVDDEPEVCNALKGFLEEEQFTVEVACDGEAALAKADEFNPHCVLLDIRMPYLGGIDVLKMIKLRQPDTEVIMVTASNNIKTTEECMRSGAFGYVTKPLDLAHLLDEVFNALQRRKETLEAQKIKKKELDHIQEERKKSKTMVQLLNEELFASLKFPIDLFEFANPEFACHCKNVSWLAKRIAELLKLEHVRLCELAGMYHDIGKLCLPEFLLQGRKLNESEAKVYDMFPVYGEDIVRTHLHLSGLVTSIRHQCEKLDGSGFPDRLTAIHIPIESKVIAVANAFDEALIKANIRNIEQDIMLGAKALDSLRPDIGKNFDPVVFEALSQVIKEHDLNARKEIEISRLSDLKPKMVLSRNIQTHSGKVVLYRKTVLTDLRIEKIIRFGTIESVSLPIYVCS